MIVSPKYFENHSKGGAFEVRGVKKRWLIQIAVLIFVLVLAVPSTLAKSPAPAAQPIEKPKLTSEQTEEIKAIYDQIFELKKQLIEKYQAYGVINEAKAQKMIDFMAKKKERLEQSGYVPQPKKKHKWKKKK
jgi:hypothetical protein